MRKPVSPLGFAVKPKRATEIRYEQAVLELPLPPPPPKDERGRDAAPPDADRGVWTLELY